MNKEDEDRQIRETRSLLQKASQRNAPLDTRRDALRRLISLTHTPSRELKVFAAQNFSHYFKDFPDLEEDVIDSVYDICEDPDSQVRIEGYKTIVALSAESKKWTRRNTDVLVQLLQSDEPAELKQIQESLISHVNLDPAAAIGVLCDHCSLDPDLTEEEKADRRKLRKIVLGFLAKTAKKDIFVHLRGPTSEAERVFREGLLKAIGGTDVQETELIVKELLLPLGSYTPRCEHGDELLRNLLDKTKLMYTDLKAKPGSISLVPLQPYLCLLEYVAVVKRAADPAPLLRFYSMALIGKMALQKLDQTSQFDVIQRLADILLVCEEERLKQPDNATSQELNSLRNMVVDACPNILESIVKSHSDDRRQWKACLTLLTACRQRQDEQRWTPPTNFLPTLSELNTLAERAPPGLQDLTRQIQTLIKDLQAERSKPVQPQQPEGVRTNKRKFENDIPPITLGPKSSLELRLTSPPAVPEAPARGTKLIHRIGGDISMGDETPTLLRRMSTSDAQPSNGASLKVPSRPSSADPTPPLSATTAVMPMLSIKGAASKMHAKEGIAQPPPTLIDRMQTDEYLQDNQGLKRKRRHKAGA